MKFDLVVFGGGTSGVACAYIASKLGLKTLLVEKTDVLGGSITQGLVIPSMMVETNNINNTFFADLVNFARDYNAQHTYIDGNSGWFNPELLKIVLDKMLLSVDSNILFSTYPTSISKSSNEVYSINLSHKILSLHIESKYIVDATGNGEIFKILNYNFQNDTNKEQAASLRFIIGGVNLENFALFLEEIDSNTDITTIDKTSSQIHLSTACTWDLSTNWALRPYFDKAVKDNILEYNDTAYFQVFTIPNMPNSLAVNAPRIILDNNETLKDPFVYSKSLIQGRERIYRLMNFCKNYLPGFEKAYISHISDTLGVRESNRIKGMYTYTKDDILNNKNFDNPAFTCNYPIDIHSNKNINDKLKKINYTYKIPIETLISSDDSHLYGIGRIISADFEAQAALRTQVSCFSMGEAVANHIKENI